MAKRLVAKATHTPIRDTSKTAPAIDPSSVADALGAETSEVGWFLAILLTAIADAKEENK